MNRDIRAPACAIVAAPYSGAAVLAAMLGRHPDLCAVPELNLALAPTVRELMYVFERAQGPVADGLLRAIGRLAFGRTDDDTIVRAQRWLSERRHLTTETILHELSVLAGPAGLVVHDSDSALRPNDLLRLIQSTAPTPIVHLVRHPWSQGLVAVERLADRLFVPADFRDHAFVPSTLDPQIAWLRANENIERWVGRCAPERLIRVLWDELVNEPHLVLGNLCQHLSLSFDPTILATMLEYDRWEFWGYGPRMAPFGLDLEVLEPLGNDLLDRAFAWPSLDRPLPWRPDGAGFDQAVKALAKKLGIES